MAYKGFGNGGKRRSAAHVPRAGQTGKDRGNMGRIFRFLLLLIGLGVLGLIGYSYSGYLVPEQTTVTTPVELDVD
jgi:hypothetical protein